MTDWAPMVLACLWGVGLAGRATPQELLDDRPPAASFEAGDGLRVRAGALLARVRTRFHLDLVEPTLTDVLGGDDVAVAPPFDRGRGLRRARWLADFGFADGSALSPLTVRAQVDFARTDLRWLDLYATLDLGLAFGPLRSNALRAGQFREEFGLEAMSSVSHLAFIERSTATNAFTPGRSRGVQWSGRGDGFGVAVGHFQRSDGRPFPDELGTERATTARAFAALDGTWLDHVGVSAALREPGADGIRLDARPGTRLLERVVDTGTVDADRAYVLGLEALGREGGTTWWAEAFGAAFEGGADARFHGGHVAGEPLPRCGRDHVEVGGRGVAGAVGPGRLDLARARQRRGRARRARWLGSTWRTARCAGAESWTSRPASTGTCGRRRGSCCTDSGCRATAARADTRCSDGCRFNCEPATDWNQVRGTREVAPPPPRALRARRPKGGRGGGGRNLTVYPLPGSNRSQVMRR